MRWKNRWLLFLVLIGLATFLIGYKLGQVPHGMTWDEAAIGYNGYAVITTRRDEWLERLPVSFRSFGDYKAPLGIYINGIFTVLFGSQLWVVRLPFALAGVCSVIGMVFLSQTVATATRVYKSERWSDQLVGGFGLAGGIGLLTAPWFLHFARTGFESGLALCLMIWGTWAVIQLGMGNAGIVGYIASKRSLLIKAVLMLVAVFGWVGALYAYHSAKLVIPVLGVVCFFWFMKKWWQQRWMSAVLGFSMTLFAWPLVYDTVFSSGSERFKQASLLAKGSPLIDVITQLGHHLLVHLDPAFLIGGTTPTLRHGDGVWGVLLPPVGLLMAIGVLLGWRKLTRSWWLVSVLWVGVGFFPAISGVDVPHSNRALLALPGVIFMAMIGGHIVWKWLKSLPQEQQAFGSHGERSLVSKSVVATFTAWFVLVFVSYQFDYYTAFATNSASEYRDGYLEAFSIARDYELGKRLPIPEKILFTSDYGQPYIYAIFVRRTNPIWYQGGSLIKYEFTDKIDSGDIRRINTLVIASGDDAVPHDEATHIIHGSDGQPRFIIFAPRPGENQ